MRPHPGSPRIAGMRTLLLLSLMLCFSAQSLALAMGPACMQGMAPPEMVEAEPSETVAMSMGHHASMHSTLSATDHSEMPCCEQAEHSADSLCQLTCASGACSAAAVTSGFPALQPLLDLYPQQLFLSTPLTPHPANLLRPPIAA